MTVTVMTAERVFSAYDVARPAAGLSGILGNFAANVSVKTTMRQILKLIVGNDKNL